MDDGTKVLLIIGLSLIILSFYIISQNAYGFDYINHNNGLWTHEPTVCIDRETFIENGLWYTLRAADSWETVFNNYGYHNFNYTMALIDYVPVDFSYCNIYIVKLDPTVIGASHDALGAASCSFELGIMLDCVIAVKDDPTYWYNTLVHELGHGLGIGHRNSYEMDGFAGVIISNDIMKPQAGLHEIITRQNVDFFIYMYGYDGWELPNRQIKEEYRIPHD